MRGRGGPAGDTDEPLRLFPLLVAWAEHDAGSHGVGNNAADPEVGSRGP
jgi:hypothetical protein